MNKDEESKLSFADVERLLGELARHERQAAQDEPILQHMREAAREEICGHFRRRRYLRVAQYAAGLILLLGALPLLFPLVDMFEVQYQCEPAAPAPVAVLDMTEGADGLPPWLLEEGGAKSEAVPVAVVVPVIEGDDDEETLTEEDAEDAEYAEAAEAPGGRSALAANTPTYAPAPAPALPESAPATSAKSSKRAAKKGKAACKGRYSESLRRMAGLAPEAQSAGGHEPSQPEPPPAQADEQELRRHVDSLAALLLADTEDAAKSEAGDTCMPSDHSMRAEAGGMEEEDMLAGATSGLRSGAGALQGGGFRLRRAQVEMEHIHSLLHRGSPPGDGGLRLHFRTKAGGRLTLTRTAQGIVAELEEGGQRSRCELRAEGDKLPEAMRAPFRSLPLPSIGEECVEEKGEEG